MVAAPSCTSPILRDLPAAQDALGSGGFTGVHVRTNTNVAITINGVVRDIFNYSNYTLEAIVREMHGPLPAIR